MKVTGQLPVLAALSLGAETPVSIEQKADWTSEQVWTSWRREKSVASAGN